MAYIIFDLDHTVIDSSHRQLTLPDGSLDLEHWLENCTREKIFGDTLLPLANSMKRMFRAGHTIIVCTARTASQHDFDYLAENGLHYHHILYRERGDMRGDAEMKLCKLNALAVALGMDSVKDMGAIMFDDNLKVLATMAANRVSCINAINENARLAA